MGALRRFWEPLVTADPVDTVTLLMLPTLLIYTPLQWYCSLPLTALCLLGILHSGFRRSFWLWYPAALVIGLALYWTWYEADNHKYLLGYICLALGCACYSPQYDARRILRVNGTALLVIAMGLAVVWKIRAPDYLNDDFFRLTLLTDERFALFTHVLAGVPIPDLAANRSSLLYFHDVYSDPAAPVLEMSLRGLDRVHGLARFMTWWTIAIEALIAMLFAAAPWGGTRVRQAAHGVLCLFLVSTYAVATVPAFCLCLIILGYSTTHDEDRPFRAAYLACALLVQVYLIPLSSLLGLV